MRPWFALPFVWAALGSLIGCTDTLQPLEDGSAADPVVEDDPESSTCNPLAAVMQPIELGHVVAVGRAADGRLYVVDEVEEGIARVFVSDGEALQRLRGSESGSRSEPSGALDASYSFEDTSGMRQLVVQIREGNVAAVALTASSGRAPGDDQPGRMPIDDIGEAEQLTLVDRRALDGMQVRNLPGEVVVEYFASVEDGRKLLVTRPRDDWSYDSFRVYFGAPPELQEQPIESVSRARDGGSTHVVFGQGGASFDAFFPSQLRMPAAPTLRSGSATLALTLHEPRAIQNGDLTFRCL